MIEILVHSARVHKLLANQSPLDARIHCTKKIAKAMAHKLANKFWQERLVITRTGKLAETYMVRLVVCTEEDLEAQWKTLKAAQKLANDFLSRTHGPMSFNEVEGLLTDLRFDLRRLHTQIQQVFEKDGEA